MSINQLKYKSQSIIEYVALIIVIIAVFIVIGSYYKRGLQGRYRQAGDVLSAGGQYQYPGYPEGGNPYIK